MVRLATCFAAASLLVWAALAPTQSAAEAVLDDSYPNGFAVDFSTVHRAVSADFLDPTSAQYKGLVAHQAWVGSARADVLCGWVNARNSLGGYTPFYPFYYEAAGGTAAVVQEYDDPNLGRLAVLTLDVNGCAGALGIKAPQ